MTLCDDMFIKVMPFVEWYSHLSSANSVISFSRLKKKKQCTWGKLNLKYWMILKLIREIVLFVDATVLMSEYYGRNIWQVKCSVN